MRLMRRNDDWRPDRFVPSNAPADRFDAAAIVDTPDAEQPAENITPNERHGQRQRCLSAIPSATAITDSNHASERYVVAAEKRLLIRRRNRRRSSCAAEFVQSPVEPQIMKRARKGREKKAASPPDYFRFQAAIATLPPDS